MKIKFQTILIIALMLALQSAYAQYAGGDGRGDFALTATGFHISNCTNPTNGGAIAGAQTICSGGNPDAFTSTTPTGQSGTLEYKWQRSTTDATTEAGFSDISPNGTSETYDPSTGLTVTTWYRRMVKVCSNPWLATTAVKVTVVPVFNAGSIKKSSEAICYGGDPAQINDSIPATGGDGSIYYQWQKSTTSGTSDFNDIADAISTSYDPPTGLQATTWYRRLAKDGTCIADWNSTASTNVVKITVQPLYLTTLAVSGITVNSATGNGIITTTCGNSATDRGVIWYPYSDSAKAIGGYQVVNVNESGSFDTGSYSREISGLTANTRYSYLAHATNPSGTGYGSKVDFWTLTNVPGQVTVNNPTTSSLNVRINANGNSAITQYAIFESHANKWVLANGTLGATAVWQTEAQWELNDGNQAKTVTGLSVNNMYTFRVKAKSGTDTETLFGLADSLYTLADVPGAPLASGKTNQAVNLAINDAVNPNITEYAIHETGTGKFVQANGMLGNDTVFQTKILWHIDAGNTVKTVTGLSPDSLYTFDVIARNSDLMKTAAGSSTSVRTYSNIPSPPLVFNPMAELLYVKVAVNGNPAHTRFAIQDSVNNLYVQADGMRGATAVWQTAAVWDTITVFGLVTGTTYYFP